MFYACIVKQSGLLKLFYACVMVVVLIILGSANLRGKDTFVAVEFH